MIAAVETAVKDAIESLAAVTEITDRIRVDHARESDDFPFVVVTVEEDVPEDTLDRGFGGTVFTTVQVQCWARTKPAARQLEFAIRHGKTTATNPSAGLIDYAAGEIQDVTWLNTTSLTVDPDDDQVGHLYGQIARYRVRSTQPTR